MPSENFDLRTWYAKRIIGDTAANTNGDALLKTGDNIASSMWILNQTNRFSSSNSKLYGIKYNYDSSGNDKIEFYGGDTSANPTSWIQLNTGAASFNGVVNIQNNSSATSTSAGALMIAGGAAIGDNIKVGTLTIGGTSENNSKTISSSDTLYLNRASSKSIIFQLNGTNGIQIDTNNYFRPSSSANALKLGTETYKWNAVYANDYYGSAAHLTLATSSVAVVTDSSGNLSTENLSVTDANAGTDANTTTFVQAVTQTATGKITVTKASLDTSGTWSGTATYSTYSTTTADTSNTLYILGVTSGASTTLKRDTSITIKGAEITAGTWKGTTIAVAQGGTGMTTATNKNAIVTGNSTSAGNAFTTVRTGSGAFYATAQDGAAQFGTLPVAQGGTGMTTATNKNAIVTGNSSSAGSAFTTVRTGNGALYATEQDGAAQFGTLPVAQGGTGQTSIANIKAGKDGDGNTISSTYLKLSGGVMTGVIERTIATATAYSLTTIENTKSDRTHKIAFYSAASGNQGLYDLTNTKWIIYSEPDGTVKSNITTTGTITSGTWNGTTIAIANGGTGQTTALDAITALGGPYILATGTEITANSNLDSGYKSAGTYYSADSTRSGTLTGTVPITGSGFKMITYVGYRSATLRQFVGGATNHLYYRSSQDTGSTWTKWYRFVLLPSGDDKKTFNAIGNATTPVYVDSGGIITAGTELGGAAYKAADYYATSGHNHDSTYAKLAGATFTGGVIVSLAKGTENHIIARATGYTSSAVLDVKLMIGSGKQNHGIWSTGYSSDGNAFTSDGKWMIYRNRSGTIIVNGDCTGSSASCTGNAATATAANYIKDWNYGSGSGETNIGALQKFFPDAPKSVATACRIKRGSTATGFGYFLSGNNYNTVDTAYGGWFVAYYNEPHYIGINSGTWTDHTILTTQNYTSIITPANIGAATSGHTHGWADLTDNADSLSSGPSNVTASTEILTSYASNNGFSDTGGKGKVYRRAASKIVNATLVKSALGTDNSTTTQWLNKSGSWSTPTAADVGAIAASALNRTSTGAFLTVQQSGTTIGRWSLQTLGSTTAEGWCTLYLGNGSSSTTDKNASGKVVLYNSNGTAIALSGGRGTLVGATRNYILCGNWFSATGVANAVWNDYAECRNVDTDDRGYCVMETPSGQMVKTTERLQAGCKITSDTFGTCMGETAEAKTPIAVSGRVLVYPYRAREEYKLGAAVCSAPGGKVDIMTRDEIMMYPERIVGTVSEIPTYEVWQGGLQDGENDIQVNGRIWIYVR